MDSDGLISRLLITRSIIFLTFIKYKSSQQDKAASRARGSWLGTFYPQDIPESFTCHLSISLNSLTLSVDKETSGEGNMTRISSAELREKNLESLDIDAEFLSV